MELIASIFLDKGYQEAITLIPLGSKYMDEVNIFANKLRNALTGKGIIISTIPIQTISTRKYFWSHLEWPPKMSQNL